MRTFVKLLLAGGALLLVSALWLRHNLPEPNLLNPLLLEEPEQIKVREAPFETSVGGVTYRIEPLFTYKLQGLVVSKHDSDTWWDYLHREWNDHLNVVDLCVIWATTRKAAPTAILNSPAASSPAISRQTRLLPSPHST